MISKARKCGEWIQVQPEKFRRAELFPPSLVSHSPHFRKRLHHSSGPRAPQQLDHELNEAGVHFSREKVESTIQIPSFESNEFEWLVAFFLQSHADSLSSELKIEINEFLQDKFLADRKIQHDVYFYWIGNWR